MFDHLDKVKLTCFSQSECKYSEITFSIAKPKAKLFRKDISNPSRDYLTVSLNDASAQITELSLYHADGGAVLKQSGLSLRQFVINLISVKPGICFLKITTSKGVLTKRIMVTR